MMLLEVDVTCTGRVRTDLAAEYERGLPVWMHENVHKQSEKNIINNFIKHNWATVKRTLEISIESEETDLDKDF